MNLVVASIIFLVRTELTDITLSGMVWNKFSDDNM